MFIALPNLGRSAAIDRWIVYRAEDQIKSASFRPGLAKCAIPRTVVVWYGALKSRRFVESGVKSSITASPTTWWALDLQQAKRKGHKSMTGRSSISIESDSDVYIRHNAFLTLIARVKTAICLVLVCWTSPVRKFRKVRVNEVRSKGP